MAWRPNNIERSAAAFQLPDGGARRPDSQVYPRYLGVHCDHAWGLLQIEYPTVHDACCVAAARHPERLEGPLHSVHIAHHRLITPSEWRAVDGVITVQ
ncbi:hypothetical protein [Mesorhizobium sp. M8A.F.Ca.ET.213.01.1.1]|uniref:hypothetical protein n=1 Tax=Mesorhizobium sp. M8A.F.Ca.ET.213.01.1.1 TaxID=2563970 RepID=UPI00387E7262